MAEAALDAAHAAHRREMAAAATKHARCERVLQIWGHCSPCLDAVPPAKCALERARRVLAAVKQSAMAATQKVFDDWQAETAAAAVVAAKKRKKKKKGAGGKAAAGGGVEKQKGWLW